jgi:hypothetical protein
MKRISTHPDLTPHQFLTTIPHQIPTSTLIKTITIIIIIMLLTTIIGNNSTLHTKPHSSRFNQTIRTIEAISMIAMGSTPKTSQVPISWPSSKGEENDDNRASNSI